MGIVFSITNLLKESIYVEKLRLGNRKANAGSLKS